MNAFERHGIKHLSPSSLALYRQQPSLWCGRYLMGWKDEAGAKMWVGNAVESGLKAWLHGTPEGDARQIAMQVFEQQAQGEVSNDIETGRTEIGPMLSRAIEQIEPRWNSKPLCQVACRHFVDGIEVPLVGYLDFAFDDGIILDLKTTRALPSKPKTDHAAQVAFYCKARNAGQGSLLYCTTKKGALYGLSPDDIDAGYRSLIMAAKAVRTLLQNSPTKQDALRTFAPDFDSFYWSDATRKMALEALT
jgi:hypothetical protein